MRQFSIFPQIAESGGSGDPFTILVSMRGGRYYPKTTIGRGVVRLGPGLEWVSGDSVHTAHVSSEWAGPADNLWSLVIRARELGSAELRASIQIAAGGGRTDEMEIRLPIVVDERGVRAGLSQMIRAETVRAGQRYRYGGQFLVPIDGPEDVTSVDIKERPQVLEQRTGKCAGCPADGRRVPFVVFVDPRGDIHSYRLLTEDDESTKATPEMIKGAEEALKSWRFLPAKAGTRRVADWVIVRVKVEE